MFSFNQTPNSFGDELRAERGLLRQLVRVNETTPPANSKQDPRALVVDAQNMEAHELLMASENSSLSDDYGIDDANSDIFN